MEAARSNVPSVPLLFVILHGMIFFLIVLLVWLCLVLRNARVDWFVRNDQRNNYSSGLDVIDLQYVKCTKLTNGYSVRTLLAEISVFSPLPQPPRQ